jgi:hypothetical protein
MTTLSVPVESPLIVSSSPSETASITPALKKKPRKRKISTAKPKKPKKPKVAAPPPTPHYNLDMRITGNLRQLRGSIALVRDAFSDLNSVFNVHDPCPGTAAPILSVEEFCTTFLLRRHEPKRKKTYATAMNRVIEAEREASTQQKKMEDEEDTSDALDWLDDF